jgi:hypothetical protein
LVNYDDSNSEQNEGQLPNLINPTQPQAFLVRLFEFLPLMAAVLGKAAEPWWQEVLEHLPPLSAGASDSVGGGVYWEGASNQQSPMDSQYALFPAETANILGSYGPYQPAPAPGATAAAGAGGDVVGTNNEQVLCRPDGGGNVHQSSATPTYDRGQLLAANTTTVRTSEAVANNTLNRTLFWTPTGIAGTRGCHVWPQSARVRCPFSGRQFTLDDAIGSHALLG